MRASNALLLELAVVVACSGSLAGQGDPEPNPAPGGRQPQDPYYASPSISEAIRDDYREVQLFGGFRYVFPDMNLEIRGGNALILFDLEEVQRVSSQRSGSGLPRRGIEPPEPRRRLSAAEIRTRLDRTLQAIGRPTGLPESRNTSIAIDLLRYIYCDGGVVVVRDGVEVLRCDRLWISPLEDRIVVENVELRYFTPGRSSNNMLVVRGPRLVREGSRWTGRNVVVTTCSAAEPHAGLASGEIEIIEREGEFEIISRGQTLMVGGASILPLPDTHIFTGSQSEFPIRRASAGYSGKEGVQAEVVFGLPWNTTGGRVHNWLTGRPASEFRGEWELGLGWIEQRGTPLSGALNYRAAGQYEGRTEAFWLDDRGDDLREVRNNLDGSPIDEETRGVVRTQNRLHLGPSTHLDLVAFHGSDAAVWPEFFRAAYRTEEVPETSVYLHHADHNRLLTVGTRNNLADFSYRDDRALSERFVEELPVVTYQWLAQPLGELPWGTPLIVDFDLEVGQRRSDYDDRSTMRIADRTMRADQLTELSAPFHWGALNIRPYVNGRGTFYDETVLGGSDSRIAFEGGVQIGTRLSRTWTWFDSEEARAVRHVIAPRLTWRNRFHVDDDPTDFFGFDTVDQLSEQQLLRFEVRNLLQTMREVDGVAAPHDYVFLDLAQDIWPEATRDNNGDTIGLLHYDLLLRPQVRWLPVDNFSFAVYGDHDWDDGLRTFDTELRFGPLLGLSWNLNYRTDALVDGAVGVGASTHVLGRWDAYVSSQRDLERDEWLSYSFGLRRNDHDWAIEAGASYNPFSDETTFRIEFLPRFGGMNGGRQDRFGGFESVSQAATSY